jgi:hypothetical protein
LRHTVSKLKKEKKSTKKKVKEFVKSKKKEMKAMNLQLQLLEQHQHEQQKQLESKIEKLEKDVDHSRAESSDEETDSHIEHKQAVSVEYDDSKHTSKRSDHRHNYDTIPVRQTMEPQKPKTIPQQQQLQQQQQRYQQQPFYTSSNPMYNYSTPQLPLQQSNPKSSGYLKDLEKEYLSQIDKYKELLQYENDRLSTTRKEFIDYVHDKTKEVESLQDQIRNLKDFILSTNSELNQVTTSTYERPKFVPTPSFL